MPSSNRFVRRASVSAAAALAAVSLGACGSSSSSHAAGNSSSPGSSSPAAVTSSSPDIQAAIQAVEAAQQPITSWPGITPIPNPVNLSGKSIMIVPLTSAVPILNGMAIGAQQALQHLGAHVTICDGKASPTTVGSCLQQAQSEHDFAVITNFVAYPMDPNGYTALAASGTKILVAGDSPVPGTTYPANVKFFDSSQSLMKLSALEADAAVADKGKAANVLSLGLTDTKNQQNQSAEVKSQFTKLCPTCGFVQTNFTTPDADKLPSAVSADMVSHPNINVVILPVDSFVPEVIQGLSSAGYLNKVEIIATGSDLSGLQRVKAGQQAHDFGAPAIYDGFALVNALEQELAGQQPTPAANVTRDFTKSNINSITISTAQYFTSNWFGNDSFEAAFYQAWGSH